MEPLNQDALQISHRDGCGTSTHHSRRTLLKVAGASGLCWLTPLANLLAKEKEKSPKSKPAKSVILLWLAGGPSQLETFDPHPGKRIAGDTKAIDTSIKGVQLAAGMEGIAEQMKSISLVRSITSKEGDHERGTYFVKTGYRPDPTAMYPTIGAICSHQLPVEKTEIPRHISILPNQWAGWGGMLGNQHDAFKTYDPKNPVPDVSSRVNKQRAKERLSDLSVIEKAFAKGRTTRIKSTRHAETMADARKMMSSEQLAAFDLSKESGKLLASYGNSPFGRGCLAARRLIQQGVRCVEVTLKGWDTHANNHQSHAELVSVLDPAFSTLLADLKEHGLLDDTIVMCGGEFGRTPHINKADGRDHWPHGFTIALAGGGIRGGKVIGATDPEGSKKVEKPQKVADVHATVLKALNIDYTKEHISRADRPIKLSEGSPIGELLS